jgi:hypothetical protein
MNKMANSKLEIRNSKQFSNDQKSENSKHARFGFPNWAYPFGFVSDFDIRISDFVSLGSWRNKLRRIGSVEHGNVGM